MGDYDISLEDSNNNATFESEEENNITIILIKAISKVPPST